MFIRIIVFLLIISLAGPGCGLIYKQNIQQGNAIEQEDLDELYIGMNRRQVMFVLGTASVMDPFHQERWDYVQTFSRRGGPMVRRTVTLKFDDDLLAEIIGRDDPVAAASTQSGGSSSSVAAFVKKPAGSKTSTSGQSPQDAAVDSVQEEVLKGVKPDIDAVDERSAEDREYEEDKRVLDQTPDDDLSTPDIDG
jgi:outer membrane protein assembly factor BamE